MSRRCGVHLNFYQNVSTTGGMKASVELMGQLHGSSSRETAVCGVNEHYTHNCPTTQPPDIGQSI